MGISSSRIAYKIGFSSALNPDTFSGYLEMDKWKFDGDRATISKYKKAFGRGFETGFKILREVKYGLKTAHND